MVLRAEDAEMRHSSTDETDWPSLPSGAMVAAVAIVSSGSLSRRNRLTNDLCMTQRIASAHFGEAHFSEAGASALEKLFDATHAPHVAC